MVTDVTARFDSLKKCRLFRNIGPDTLREWFSGRRASDAQRGEILALEGEELTHLGILLDGSAQVSRGLPSGGQAVIGRLEAGDTFGEALLFYRGARYPATVTATESASVLRLSREQVAKMCGISAFAQNFMGVLSERIVRLQERVMLLSYPTLRQRIAAVLLRQAQGGHVRLGMTRQEMADMLGTVRPSLSREISRMAKMGWIEAKGKSVEIVDERALRACLTQESSEEAN